MDFIFDKDKLEEVQQIISLYKKFDRYKDNTREELYYHILPSIKLKQYKTFKENNKVIAFANWAYLDNETEKQFINTGDFDNSAWNNGDKAWVIDVVSQGKGAKMVHWLRHKFNQVKWMRSDKNFKFYKIGKRNFNVKSS